MRLVWIFFAGHALALIFGLAGLLIALPNPQLWIDSRFGPEMFRFGLEYGGSLHVWWGALAMLFFGGLAIGWRKTLIFFFVACTVSLSSELIGTTTGWPFGDYAYLSGLGNKVLGRVPYTIPLSWFYLGFASYLLANSIAGNRSTKYQAFFAIAGGAYFLVVWDLVLDPAMAHESMPIRFWAWSEGGPYFGMPLINFAGWALTGAVFMTVSRLLWKTNPDPRQYSPVLPYAMYLLNIGFGAVLAISVDLWIPMLLAVIFGVIPASLALRRRGPVQPSPVEPENPTAPSTKSVSYRAMQAGFELPLKRNVQYEVEGLENIPATGPAMLVARHYHHLYDGGLLISSCDRPLHILVGLDWVTNRFGRWLMEFVCRVAGWPYLLRRNGPAFQRGDSAYKPDEIVPYLRRAINESVELLRRGELLVVFPEGYPAIDPEQTLREESNGFMPFEDGFAYIASRAQAGCAERFPLVPVGFNYQRLSGEGDKWSITMRIGEQVYVDEFADCRQLVHYFESEVRALSRTPDPVPAVIARELVAP